MEALLNLFGNVKKVTQKAILKVKMKLNPIWLAIKALVIKIFGYIVLFFVLLALVFFIYNLIAGFVNRIVDTIPHETRDFAIYSMDDVSYRDIEFDKGKTIGDAGSGICSVATIVTALGTEVVTPAEIVNQYKGNSKIETPVNLLHDLADKYNFETNAYGREDSLEKLKQNENSAALCMVGNGHYVVVRYINNSLEVLNPKTVSGTKPGDAYYSGKLTEKEFIDNYPVQLFAQY